MLPVQIFNALIVEEEERFEEFRQFSFERRLMRDTSDPFTLREEHFKDLFRLSRATAHFVFDRILPLIHNTDNIVAIPAIMKFFAALSFYATGSYQRTIGQSSQSTSSAILQVTEAIEQKLARERIISPTTNEMKINLKAQFMEKTRFPGTIGAIDCTHVAIIAPSTEEHNYLNRKGFHSKNIQIICNYDLKILNVNPRYGGATHDSFIWRNSVIRQELERRYNQGDHNTWLLGDSGYPQEPWLMTPVVNAHPNTPEFNYTEVHAQARNCVERCIGVLKGRFRCIMGERKLRYAPEKVGHIVNVCTILHNLCVAEGMEINVEVAAPQNIPPPIIEPRNNDGFIARQELINNYFR